MDKLNFAKGAILGAIAGVIGGILFAPKSGRRLRQELAGDIRDMKKKAARKFEVADDYAKDRYNNAVAHIISGYRKTQEMSPEATEAIEAIFSKSYKDIQRIVNEGRKKLS